MFTGIVVEVGEVLAPPPELRLRAPHTARDAAVGDSVSIEGCCLTVTAVDGDALEFHAVPETLRISMLGDVAAGGRVNLEPALRVGDRMAGHWVQGHVDAVGRVRRVDPEGEGARVWFDAPEPVLRYCAEKGSVAVDGVSLTVAALDEDGFAVALVPFTLEATTLGALGEGDDVNLEADVLAKYVERLLSSTRR